MPNLSAEERTLIRFVVSLSGSAIVLLPTVAKGAHVGLLSLKIALISFAASILGGILALLTHMTYELDSALAPPPLFPVKMPKTFWGWSSTLKRYAILLFFCLGGFAMGVIMCTAFLLKHLGAP